MDLSYHSPHKWRKETHTKMQKKDYLDWLFDNETCNQFFDLSPVIHFMSLQWFTSKSTFLMYWSVIIRGFFVHLHPILQIQKSSENNPIFLQRAFYRRAVGVKVITRRRLEAWRRLKMWTAMRWFGIKELSSKDAAACDEEKIGAVIV